MREDVGVIELNQEFNLQDDDLSFEQIMEEELTREPCDDIPHQNTSAGDLEKPVAKKPKRKFQETLSYVHDMVLLIAVVVVVFLLFFRVVVVSGQSMNNTLLDGDYLLLISNLFYQEPKQGDIIVASKGSFDNGAPIVKRVIATEGQVVNIDFEKGIVTVNGVPLDEPYILEPTVTWEGIHFPLTVEEGCIFVMGDNRNNSKDSRSPEIGLIDTREVLGKVIFLFLPGTNGNESQRDFSRIGAVS